MLCTKAGQPDDDRGREAGQGQFPSVGFGALRDIAWESLCQCFWAIRNVSNALKAEEEILIQQKEFGKRSLNFVNGAPDREAKLKPGHQPCELH